MTYTRNIPIFDGHNDSLTATFLETRGKGISIMDKSRVGHIDVPRAMAGSMIGGFFAIQTPPEKLLERAETKGFHISENGYFIDVPSQLRQAYAEDFVDRVIQSTLDLEKDSPQIKIIRGREDVPQGFGSPLSLLIHLEGAEAVKDDLSNLSNLYAKGVRSLGLFWSRPNSFGYGVQYKFPSSPDIGNGLTKEGKELIRACNDLGIIVDLAHINENGFWDAVEVCNKPFVITHTAVHAICNSSRNLTDTQLKAVGKAGGVVGIIFEPMMISKFGLKLPKGKTLDEVFAQLKKTPLSQIVQHIDYIVKNVGIDYVALGSDMDGAIMPTDLKDASLFQNIVEALSRSGYSKSNIEKICYRNWIRVICDIMK